MNSRGPSRRLLRALNLAVLGGLYLALIPLSGAGAAHYRALVVCGVALGVIALWSLGIRVQPREAAGRLLGRARVAIPLAIAPWAGLLAVVSAGGLWWIQRPAALKLFVLYALANWSIAWCNAIRSGVEPPPAAREGLAEPRSGTDVDRSVRVLLAAAAVVLALLAIDGMAFGVSAFGAAASALLALLASLIVVTVFAGSRTLRMNAFAACLGLALGLTGAEVGIRVLHLGDSLLEIDSVEYARRFHHITPPGSAFVNRPKPLDEFAPALVEINSLGIRGPEIRPGPVDLLLIGDSMIEARQLDWQETLPPRLERTLRQRSIPARVVGQGVRGWSPLLEWNWYLKVGRRLHARTVLLFFFWNDLWPSGSEARTFNAVMTAAGRPDHFEVAVDPDFVWYKHVRAVRLLEDVLQRVGLEALRRTFSMIGRRSTGGADLAGAKVLARQMAGPPLTRMEIDALLTKHADQLDSRLRNIAENMFWPGIRPLNLWTGAQREAAAQTETELRRFAEDVAADGGRLVIVYVPNAYQIARSECSVSRALDGLDDEVILPRESGIQDWLHTVAVRHHIELLDPSEAMRQFLGGEGAAGAPLYLRADCHWTPRGHQFMANYLADWYEASRTAGRH